MAKRKNYKRPRRKQVLYHSQEMLLQKSNTSDDDMGNEAAPLKRKGRSSERLLEQRSPESVLFETQQVELSCYDDLSPEIAPRVRRRKLDLNGSDKDNEQHDCGSQQEAELAEVEQDEPRKETTDMPTGKCFPMDKTLSMSDAIKLEMNDCESLQEDKYFSETGPEAHACDSNIHSSKSAYDLPCGYVSEPAQLATFNSDVEAQNQGFSQLLAELRSAVSACEPIGQFEEENNGDKWGGGARFEVGNETSQDPSGTRFTANLSECKRIISNLRQLNSSKMRATTQEYITNFLSKYKKVDEARSVQTSFCGRTPSPLASQEDSNERANKRPFAETDEADDKVEKRQEYKDVENNVTRIRARSTTPCSGSPPPAKRCRTTLKFDDDEEIDQPQKPAVSTTITDLLPEETKNGQSSFCPSAIITKMPWSTCTPESPSTLTLDLPVVSDSGCCSRCLQEHERETDYHKKCTCCSSRTPKSPRFRLSKRPVVKVVLFCAWLTKRLTNTFKKSCGGFKKTLLMCSSKRRAPKLEKLNELMIMLRSENQQMINTFIEKVSHLSEEITQVRASHASALGALTAKVGSMQDVTRKLAENNETLMQELKKLQKALEDTRRSSPKPPPPMSSILRRSSPLSAPPPPPPPPPPPFCLSPAQPMTPTTPGSGRSVRTPSRKCSTPLLGRPAITVEDLLKVTLKKAPQNVKENRRNTIPGPRGPMVSLDMLRSVKLKSARRRTTDQILRSPRSARMIKTRTAPSLSLSPIMAGGDSTLRRILKQVDVNRRGPRRLLSGTSSFRETSIARDNQSQNADARDSSTQSAIV